MNKTTLVIADKNYSLWPLAPWLCMKKAKMPFTEILIRFGQHNTREKMLEYGPTGRVPVLIHNGLKVWDSLAICEFVNDLYPSENLWPENLLARAQARTFAAEMHATGGAFPGAPRHIIYSLDTNVRRRTDRVKPKNHLLESINYLITRWKNLIHAFGGPGGFLFGEFTIADAMSAHVVNRFYTYDIKLPNDINNYCKNMRQFSPLAQWIREAESEDWTLPSAEIDVSKL
tara:strand:+ start:1500 stop:2189 length:690 start_codon:yes stop_codon:yes gene_type:complete